VQSVQSPATATISANGTSVPVSTATAYQSMQLTFSGVAGQTIALQVSETCSGSSGLCAGNPTQYLSIIGPDGFPVYCAGWAFNSCGGTQTFPVWTGAVLLPQKTGTYTITLVNTSANVGQATFTLYNAPPLTSSLGVSTGGGSQPVTLTSTTPGQNFALTFSGTAGEAITLDVTEPCSGATGLCAGNVAQYLTITAPDGSATYTNGCCTAAAVASSTGLLSTNSLVLSQTGTYTVNLASSATTTGAATFTLTTPLTSAISISTAASPQPVTLTGSYPGQSFLLTFSGVTGHAVGLEVSEPCSGTTGLCIGNPAQYLVVTAPDRTTVLYTNGCCGAATVTSGTGLLFTNGFSLTQTGTYTIALGQSTTNTGAATFTLYDATPVSGAISLSTSTSLQPVTLAANDPGQSFALTFSGVAGHAASLEISEPCSGSTGLCAGNPNPQQYINVTAPDGKTLAYTNVCCGTPATVSNGTGLLFTNSFPLPQTGTYTITLAQNQADTGSATFTLFDTTVVSSPITAGGSPVTLQANDPGQVLELTFSGTKGVPVSLLVNESCTSNTGLCAGNPSQHLELLAPDGSTYVYNNYLSTNGVLWTDAVSLPQTGTYTITLAPSNTNTGSATFTLYNDQSSVIPISANGSTVNVTTSTPGQSALLSFTGSVGNTVSLVVTENGSSLDTGSPAQYLTITAPDGTTQIYASGCCSTAPFWSGALVLPQAGTYNISLSPTTTNTGTASFNLYSVPANVSASTSIGATGTSLTTTVPGQSAQIKFSAASGSSFTFNVTAVSQTNCDTATILEPDGKTVLAQSGICGTSGSLHSGTVPSSGTYTAVITPGGPATGSYTLGATSP